MTSTKDSEKVESSINKLNNDLEKKIVQQVEFYFGDYNLPCDNYLLHQLKIGDGWIPIRTILKFSRLKKLTTDPEIFKNALRNSDFIEVSNDRVRRSPLFPAPKMTEERRTTIKEKTLYIEGFPLNWKLDDLLAKLQNFSVEKITMIKSKKKSKKRSKFTGALFAVFSTKEAAENFFKLESFKVGNIETTRKFQADYLKDKNKQIKQILEKELRSAVTDEHEKLISSQFKKGTMLRLSGDFTSIGESAIRASLHAMNTLPTDIKFTSGDSEVFVRLVEGNLAEKFADQFKDGLIIGSSVVQAAMLTSEEEEQYFKKALNEKIEKAKNIEKMKGS